MSIYLGSNQIDTINLIQYPNINNDLEDAFIEGTISNYTNSECSFIRTTAFEEHNNLISISFPNCTHIDDYGIAFCDNLTTISFPKCKYIGEGVFHGCSSLIEANLPNCTSINSYVFGNCYSLMSVSLPKCTFVGNRAFYSCFNLLSMCLLGSSVATLVSTNVFGSTPISNYTTSTSGVYGSIYVPTSLYSSYIVASNWSVYSARIVGVGTMTINYFNDAYSEDYLYEPSMTWADWVNSKYNTANFVVDPETSYVGIWDDVNNTYIYLSDDNNPNDIVISTHKIIEDMNNKVTSVFTINTTLNGGN